ncbi:hypothetical protein [Halomonas sp. WWR20]
MAHRPDSTRLGPIVPEREDGAQPTRYTKVNNTATSRTPHVWPLWVLTLLLTAGMGVGGYAYWQQREAWQARLEGMNQRVETLQERIAATDNILDASGASLRDELDRLRSDLEASQAVIGSLDQRVVDTEQLRPEALRASIDALEKADATRQATLVSLQESMQALERLGEEKRGLLSERLEGVAATQSRQSEQLEDIAERQAALASLAEKVEEQQTAFESLMSQTERLEAQVSARGDRLDDLGSAQEAIVARLDSLEAAPGQDSAEVARLEERLETLASSDESLQTRMTNLDDNVQQLERSLRELRQAQTAMSASLESLRAGMESLSQGPSSRELRDLSTRMESLEASRAQLTRRVTSLLSDVATLQRQTRNG